MPLAGETEVLGEETAQVPLCAPLIAQELAWNRNPFSLVDKLSV